VTALQVTARDANLIVAKAGPLQLLYGLLGSAVILEYSYYRALFGRHLRIPSSKSVFVRADDPPHLGSSKGKPYARALDLAASVPKTSAREAAE
jgi:hypothetical protein